MKEALLFDIGGLQYCLALHQIRGIRSASSLVIARPEGRMCVECEMEGKRIVIYDLAAIFGNHTAHRRYKSEKVVIIALPDFLAGFVVDAVNRVVPVSEEQLKPLPAIFSGSALACFPKVMREEGALILLLQPEGIAKAAEDYHDTRRKHQGGD